MSYFVQTMTFKAYVSILKEMALYKCISILKLTQSFFWTYMLYFGYNEYSNIKSYLIYMKG